MDVEAGIRAVLSVAATIVFANWINTASCLLALPAHAVLGRWVPAGPLGRFIMGVATVGQVVLVAGAIRWAGFPP